jgi:hypothetical protein
MEDRVSIASGARQGNWRDDRPNGLAGLTDGQVRLVRACQQINFGRIEGLLVRSGEPVFDPPPAVIRTFKFGADNLPRLEQGLDAFKLRAQVLDLFAAFRQLRDARVDVIQVKHGLPFSMDARRT